MRSRFPLKSSGTLGRVAAATVMKDMVAAVDGLGQLQIVVVLE